MKKASYGAMLAALAACMILYLVGCGKSPEQIDPNWTPPISVTDSHDGLAGWVSMHGFHGTLVGVSPVRRGAARLLLLDRAKNAWSELPVPSVPVGYIWAYAAIDSHKGTILVPDDYAEGEQLVIKALMGTISGNRGLHGVTETQWMTDKKALFRESGSHISLTGPMVKPGVPNRNVAGLGIGVLHGSDFYIPFSFAAKTYIPPNTWSNSPFSAGVFHSDDSGNTWRMEKASDWEGGAPAICRTTERIYYFATYPGCLWSSGKRLQSDEWDASSIVTKKLSIAMGRYDVTGEGDTAHVCWMDRRHNKMRFNLTGPPIENNDIYYRHRKDTDSKWDKEVWLSKGLLYCYAPTIAAEGDNVVVAWAGIRDADKSHTYMNPNEIYYVTSKDGGRTWTKPLQVTDGAKDRKTAGMPQVALLNGTIHLLYTQGKQAAAEELSPGLTRMGGEPWPIYHTSRPFPK